MADHAAPGREAGRRLSRLTRTPASAAARRAPAPPPGVTPAGIGDPMPAIALPGLDGAIVDLRTRYAGRRLLINVWASWCGPCIEEMPELDRFAATQGREGVQVIGLALDTPDGVRDFIARVPVRYPILLDAPGPAVARVRLGNANAVLPYTVLGAADGRSAREIIGPSERGEHSGRLLLATTHTQARYVLPPVIAAIKREFPQVNVDLQAAGDALQVAGGAGVLAERLFQCGRLEQARVPLHQVLEGAAFERQEVGTEDVRVQREQLFQHRVHFARPGRLCALVVALRRAAVARLVVVRGRGGGLLFRGNGFGHLRVCEGRGHAAVRQCAKGCILPYRAHQRCR